MSDDSARQTSVTVFTYDPDGRLTDLREYDGEAAAAELAARDGTPEPAFAFEHDAARGVFPLTAPDGSTEVFRDKPTRYLCASPDTASGEMRPVLKRGKPVYLHLAREEREIC